jgi:methylaspartate mutase sigma subunit
VYDRSGSRVSAPVVVIGVIGNDIHVVANRVLDICLTTAGLRTVNLGTNNMPQDFADTALECSADAVLIGSLNGEAPYWCRHLRTLFEERGIGEVLIYLGGNVVTGDLPKEEIDKTFYGFGVDRVYQGAVDFDLLIESLKKDIVCGRPIH